MTAQTLRLNMTASNMANAETVSTTEEQAYKARHPVFQTMLQQAGSAGVNVLGVVESKAVIEKQYAPEHPLANEEGLIFKSNVNQVEEMVNMISASRSYQANVEIMNTSKQLLARTLRLGE